MKLTNISLAILVAIGLVACGGSDDNKNQPTDNNNAGHQGAGNGNPPPPPPPKGDSALDPKRAAPDLTVADDVKSIVEANKRIFVNRGFANPALGYSNEPGEGYEYDKKFGTDPANVKLTSTYNYSEAGDLIPGAISGYGDKAAGAIFVAPFEVLKGNDFTKLNAFVETKDGYIRVAVDNTQIVTKDDYTPDTKFYPVNKDNNGVDTTGKSYDQSEVVFIANAVTDTKEFGVLTKPAFDLGQLKNGTFDQYDETKTQVVLNNVKVFGTEYPASTTGQNLDFSQLNAMREIQTEKVTGSYNILNLKGNADSNDDKVIPREITLGNIKAYNLPYSIALVTTNLDEKKPAEKDIFNMGSAFQVLGFQTVSLPQDGRAFYTGKSFNAKITGDVILYADFFENRAGIEGVIKNRKDNKGTQLADLTLKRIPFVTGGQNYKTGDTVGVVTGDPAYADNWTVQLYGQEAQEAAGMIRKTNPAVAPNPVTYTIKEVYNTQRGALTNKSNDSTVTP